MALVGAAGSGRPIVIENKIHLDGKQVAENTTRHAENEAALR
jgi:hypothetical protein